MSYFWQARQARPVTGRQGGRPNWRGTGDPPASHMLINEDAGTPAVGIPSNALTTNDPTDDPLIDSGGNILTTG